MTSTVLRSTMAHETTIKVPGLALLNLASDIVDGLHRKLKQDYDQQEAAGPAHEEQATETYEQRVDLAITQQCIDRKRWAEVDRGVSKPEDIQSVSQRMKSLLDLSNIPKSQYVIADAIRLRRQTREKKQDDTEDGMLDLLSLMSQRHFPSGFFQLQSIEGHANGSA